MSTTCPNCGLSNESDSKFCSQCGFQLPGTDSVSFSEFLPPTSPSEPITPPSRSSSKPVVFVSKGSSYRYSSPPSRGCSRSPRRQHSGWLMGVLFLSIGLFFVVLLLTPMIFGFSYNSHSIFSDFGSSMGHMGGSIGEFFGNLGGSLGEFFGGIGERLGDFFGGFGTSIGDTFHSGVSFSFFPLFFLSLFPLLFILIAFIAILRSVRINRQSQ